MGNIDEAVATEFNSIGTGTYETEHFLIYPLCMIALLAIKYSYGVQH